MPVLLSASQRLNIFSNLSTMLVAGIPVLEAVNSLADEAKGTQQKVLKHIAVDLNQGKTLSQSLQRFPDAFDAVPVNLIRAAEEAGTLETTLQDLVVSTEQQIELSDKIKSALTYPALVIVVFIGVILSILTFVIPRIASVFQRLNVVLPLPTRVLIVVSNIWLQFTPVVLGGALLLVALLLLLVRYRRRQLLRLFSSLPGFSGLAKMNDLANFTRSLHLLLKSGIPITQALDLSEQIVTRGDIAKAIRSCGKTVANGKPLVEGFKAFPKIFPPLLVRIASAGEKSGQLEKSMAEANHYFTIQINKNLKRLTILLEPAMLVVIGLLVGGMMLAIIAPIYGLIGQLSPQ